MAHHQFPDPHHAQEMARVPLSEHALACAVGLHGRGLAQHFQNGLFVLNCLFVCFFREERKNEVITLTETRTYTDMIKISQ